MDEAGRLTKEGRFDEAFEYLRRAIELDDALPYDEPWGWMQPTRHAYGALMLEQGRVEEAAAVYAADLGLDDTLSRCCQHPNNVWSLHGYHECLTRLGRDEEAAALAEQLARATARADVPIVASCACRQTSTDERSREEQTNTDERSREEQTSTDGCCGSGQ